MRVSCLLAVYLPRRGVIEVWSPEQGGWQFNSILAASEMAWKSHLYMLLASVKKVPFCLFLINIHALAEVPAHGWVIFLLIKNFASHQ